MKSEKDLKDALACIALQDQQCPTTAHIEGRQCLDFGHALRGTWARVLYWVLDQGNAPWK